MNTEEKYIHRCIQLARNGKGFVAPNPMVGAVIVCDGKIIGEGYHRKYGEAHAEVNAINSVKDHSLLKKSVMYVNLEPCSHYGKTPPCASLIIEKQIPKVVIGHSDPFPDVSGRGIRMLKEAGIEVVTDVLKDECERLNKRFLTYTLQKRPYIILKWAQSSDGFLDKRRNFGSDEKPVRLSSDFTTVVVHKLRAQESAILVGTRTALLDNPSLTTRYWHGNNPLRIVIDKDLKIPFDFNLFDGSVPTLVYTEKNKVDSHNIFYRQINFNENLLSELLADLYEKKIQSLIVEGGSFLINSFISKGLWDEANVEIVCMKLNSGISAPLITGTIIKADRYKKSVIYHYNNNR